MSVVFVTNFHPDHDYRPATEFGALRPVTSGNYPIFKTQRLLEEICDSLQESSENDFLLFSGSSTIAGLALAVWLSKHSKANLLLFERAMGRNKYVVRTITKHEVLQAIEEARERKELSDESRSSRAS
jgi:hypothetical protein